MAMIGIDLGTTNSVVTTPQSFEGKFFERIRGITLIKDAYNQRFTPSVVAQTARGELVVGRRAKNRAGLSPPPITSIKRRMGESTRTSLGDRDLLPEEVSAEILRHLKAMAEQQMGEPVEQAVVTVPAHFTQLQKQKTREAAELAGLEVGDIVLEPVAAALAYCHDDQRDPLTIMTYDLGGDTFDVAVLRKEGGELSILALDGDRYLGGCDFDKRLASWILDQLNEGMYELEAPEGSPAWAKLMVYAEWAKIRLSSSEITELMELSTGIVDENGEPVSIELEVPRSVLEEQIEAQIDQSVRLCRRALDKAEPPISPEQVDEIVLVGGSSRIPMVSRKLEQAFDRKPRMENPDLCVALGAAMIARDLGRRMGPVKLGPIPERTSLASIQVTGQVLQTEQITAPSSCTVVLTPADGQVPTRQLVSNHGGFLFAQVPLAPDTANRFVLRLDDSGGQEILSYPLTVVREAVRATARTHPELPPNNVLERPIYIMNGRGLPVVRARTLMPHHCRTSTQTTNQSGMVQIPIFEGRCMIGEFLVRVPADLPEGTLVKIDLTFSADFLVDMVARVDSVDIEERAAITLFPTESIGLAQLRNEYMAVSRIASKAFSRADAGQASAVISRLNSALAACQQELYKRAPNLATGQELLAEVGSLVEQLGVLALDPPPEKLDELLLEIEHQLPALVRNDVGAAMHLWPTLHCLTSLAHEALIARDAAAWKDAYVRSQELRREVDLALAAALPEDPRSIKLKLAMALSRLRQDARNSNKYEDLAPAFSRCSSKLKDIDADRSDAIQRLDRYNKNDYRPLKAQVTGISPANVVPIKKNPIQFPPGIFACMETESRGGKVFFYKCDLERLGNQPPRWIGTHMETHPGSRHRIFLRDENRWIDAEAVPEIKRLLSRERGGGAEMPPGTMDLLQFSVTAPPELQPGCLHLLNIWAYLAEQRQEVITRAKESAHSGEVQIDTKGPIKVARGTVLTARLYINGLNTESAEDAILWDGEIGNATFIANVPRDAAAGARAGWVTIRKEGHQIARVTFLVHVGPRTRTTEFLSSRTERINSAFACYARKDRDAVLDRLQGLMKGLPDLDIFFDVASLRSGENWRRRLRDEIVWRDVMYLFWSRAAAQSKWVEWEWRCGLDEHGIQFIDPVPLEPPEVAPPPEELGGTLHFNDWMLALKSAARHPEYDRG